MNGHKARVRAGGRVSMADPDLRTTASSAAPTGVWARVGKDLLPRLVSAVVLAALVAAFVWAGGYVFAGLVAGVAAIIAWEWGRIIRGGAIDTAMAAHIAVVLFAVGLAAADLIGLAVLAIVVGAILVNLLTVGRHPGLSALGVLYAGLPAVALLWLRDGAWGLAAIGFLVLAVAATDTGAYFAGRLIGGPKLAPRISPNKTWAGLLGAMAASGLVGVAAGNFIAGASVAKLAMFSIVLAIVAQAGDLGESWLKRKFGAKDASNIIPGHGGFMDRVDGLIAAVVFAALLGALMNVRDPAKAILLW